MSEIPIDPSAPAPTPVEIRYSAAQMLAELKHERATGAFGLEKLSHGEIGKLFKAKAPRHVKRPK